MNSPFILLAIPNAIHSLGPCAGITCIPEIGLKRRVNLRIADNPGATDSGTLRRLPLPIWRRGSEIGLFIPRLWEAYQLRDCRCRALRIFHAEQLFRSEPYHFDPFRF